MSALSLVSPRCRFHTAGRISGMGEPQGAQNAQPDTKTHAYREHAAGALAGHGLGFFDEHMRLWSHIGC